jgi:hypothetical protein
MYSRSREVAAQIPVESISIDPLGRRCIRGIGLDQVVKGPFGIEERHIQSAGGLRSDLHRALPRCLADAERVLESQRGIEGHDKGIGAAPGRLETKRRGKRRLADSAGPTTEGGG